jgi:hypothetical protein
VSKRDLLWLCVGGIVVAWFGYGMAQRQAAWEARTIACWPNKTHPN